ncbi:hypothetical protein [Streptomyces sp. NBC_00525]|uniref:hypothetical protein n=1 Tax=Streptomyces sp. NBC_00525 TaxID=2903660 RepID=UPI003FCCB739
MAETVHHYYVSSNVHPEELPSTAELLQIIVLFYRLAWQARDLITTDRENTADSWPGPSPSFSPPDKPATCPRSPTPWTAPDQAGRGSGG